jgi:hypothetical protein
MEAAGWAEVGPGRPVGPAHFEAQSAPFDLAANLTIYSPEAKSHTFIHSSSTAEEQRSLRDTISERRVMLVI